MSEFTSEEYEAEISKYVLLVNKHYNKRLEVEKQLKEINKIAHSIWKWMCERETAIIALIPPIDKIMELSEFKEKDPLEETTI